MRVPGSKPTTGGGLFVKSHILICDVDIYGLENVFTLIKKKHSFCLKRAIFLKNKQEELENQKKS